MGSKVNSFSNVMACCETDAARVGRKNQVAHSTTANSNHIVSRPTLDALSTIESHKDITLRQIALSDRKLRGIPRRLRALERWAAKFNGRFYPHIHKSERYAHWKIPVINSLVQGPHAHIEVQAFCIQQLLEAAAHLSRAADRSQGYYRVACLLVWPFVHQSEVTVFYDRDYYLSFLGQHNTLAPLRLSDRLALNVPESFIEHGHDVTQSDDEVDVHWWCIGEPA
ncbi:MULTISPECIES: DUF3916 domain-containing protein [unclassified Pseudomonas]|uniref:DUF3916 domain-containing protein n=1 Tax=unclassified Pseudomonas TaxID=196821 RepID=UPI002113D125|nr:MULTISPECIES: DUF3916 domain-containing protein [unclassified Pseudomonas]